MKKKNEATEVNDFVVENGIELWQRLKTRNIKGTTNDMSKKQKKTI